MSEFLLYRDGVGLAGAVEGEGTGADVVLLHGLTATRRYVLMGSSILARAGHRVTLYDARGHGVSGPAAAPDEYGYHALAEDLLAVLDHRGIERAVLAGASMGAHTLLAVALGHPERVAGALVITPAYAGEVASGARLAHWDALSAGLRAGGIEGFLAAYNLDAVPERFRATVEKVIRQRLALHEHPDSLADALSCVPRSPPFGSIAELAALEMPVTVVASDDAADPEHPRAVGEAYAAAIPGAQLVVDAPGRSPVAWQGSQLSRLLLELIERSR